ncbi:MAG: hypothetical protein RR482_05430 [Clostridia bacterium]
MNRQEKEILRTLAEQVAQIAARPEQAAKRQLWKDHNMLRPTRPVIFCDPEHGWQEILPDASFRCTEPLARAWEFALRRQLFWGEEMGDDRVIEPFFDIPYVSEDSGWGVEKKVIGGGDGLAYTWEAPIGDYARDLPKMHFPHITVDLPATQERLALAHEIFEPFLKPRIKQMWWWSLGMTRLAIAYRGLEQFMLDMYDEPEGLHRLMAFLRDGTLEMIDTLQRDGLLCDNADESYVGSGGFGYTDELPVSPDRPALLQNMWGFCESQETVSVSPAMFEEFVFPYQLPILEKFGLNCYGCCEPLDRRWHIVQRIPRLRRVSVSPWANCQKMAEALGNRYVYSLKPNPADLAVPHPDFARIGSALRETMQIVRDCRVELIMKDNHTLGGNPANAAAWCHLAKDIAESL